MSIPATASSPSPSSSMEIIFGRNKKEQLEPVSATVTGETSVFIHGHPFSVFQVPLGSLETCLWEQDKPRPPKQSLW